MAVKPYCLTADRLCERIRNHCFDLRHCSCIIQLKCFNDNHFHIDRRCFSASLFRYFAFLRIHPDDLRNVTTLIHTQSPVGPATRTVCAQHPLDSVRLQQVNRFFADVELLQVGGVQAEPVRFRDQIRHRCDPALAGDDADQLRCCPFALLARFRSCCFVYYFVCHCDLFHTKIIASFLTLFNY